MQYEIHETRFGRQVRAGAEIIEAEDIGAFAGAEHPDATEIIVDEDGAMVILPDSGRDQSAEHYIEYRAVVPA